MMQQYLSLSIYLDRKPRESKHTIHSNHGPQIIVLNVLIYGWRLISNREVNYDGDLLCSRWKITYSRLDSAARPRPRLDSSFRARLFITTLSITCALMRDLVFDLWEPVPISWMNTNSPGSMTFYPLLLDDRVWVWKPVATVKGWLFHQ